MLSAAGGCELSTTTRENVLEEVQGYQFSFSATSLSRRMAACIAHMRRAMLHASETWPLTKPNLQRLQRNDGNDQTNLQCQAARHCHHQVQ